MEEALEWMTRASPLMVLEISSAVCGILLELSLSFPGLALRVQSPRAGLYRSSSYAIGLAGSNSAVLVSLADPRMERMKPDDVDLVGKVALEQTVSCGGPCRIRPIR